jgi:2'-phosphotransferase
LKITLPELREIVANNEKQRFKLIPLGKAPGSEESEAESSTVSTGSDDPSQWLIRANQGHSIKVDEEGLLEPITLDSDLPTTVVHGTTPRAWPLIFRSGGLNKMTRNHIHFASGLPAGFKTLDEAADAANEVKKEPIISGMRKSSNVLIFIDIRKALEGGIKFWRSANGVILSDGNDEGVLPVEYFKRVEQRKAGQGLIMEDGQLVSEENAKKGTQ